MESPHRLPPAGWYQDPHSRSILRYWTGEAWTVQVLPVSRAQILGITPGPINPADRPQPKPKPKPQPRPARPLPPPRQLFVGQFLAVTLVVCGLLVAGFSSWQLWGTNIYNAYEQQHLQASLDNPAFDTVDTDPYAVTDPLAVVPTTIPQAPAGSAITTTTTSPPAPISTANSAAIGRITAPSIGLDQILVRGTDPSDLAEGPGWMVGTAEPGLTGNTVISGHRTTHGAPFRHLDGLKVGDKITISLTGRPDAVYEVRASFVVDPTDGWVTAPTSGARLTLTTCTPAGSDKHRLIIQAELVQGIDANLATPASSWVPSHK